MIRVLEVFSGSMPGWIKNNLTSINNYEVLAKRYDFANADFYEDSIPASNRDKRLKDPNRINFFLLNVHNKLELAIYLNGHWFTPLKKFGIGSWQEIVDSTEKFAYAEVTSGDNAEDLRKARAELKKGAIALQRNIYGWMNNRDKSGYIVDKNKYKKILSTSKLGNYVRYFDEVNDIIRQAKETISDFVMNIDNIYSIYDLSSYTTKGPGGEKLGYVRENGALKDLRDLLRIASNLNDVIKNVQNGNPASEYSYILDNVDGYVDDAWNLLDKIKKLLEV